ARGHEPSLLIDHLNEAVPVGLCVVDRELRYLRINERLARLNGAPAARHLGRTIQEMIPEMAPLVEPAVRQVLATGQPIVNVEVRKGKPNGPDGEKCWLVSYHPLKDPEGSIQGVISVVEDISERRSAEARLRESEQRFALAIGASGVGVWDWNLDTSQIFVDPKLKAILGFEDHEIRNHIDDWGLRVHPEDMERVMQEATRHLEGSSPHYEVEHRMLHKDGSVRWFLARGLALRDESGRPYRMLGTDTDISERKRAEETLRRTEQLNRAILGSVPNEIAVLDAEGRIITVNDAWGGFAQSFPEAKAGVGVNYLEVCQRASRSGSVEAAEAFSGIQSVLTGSGEFFDMEYECPTPSGSRWFLMTVSPLRGGDRGAV
ncbi:MAG: PAS domain-containing protein, partial [Acidobacteria bacterium]|nr:PAS domain-containing protein [Acidobacteriota bacterium]